MNDELKKYPVETFTMYAGVGRGDERNRLDDYIESLPIDRVFRVKVIEGEEGRSEVANRLYQVSIGQIVKQTGKDESAVAGWSKYHCLLPMKVAYAAETENEVMMAQAEFERSLCELLLTKYDGLSLYKAFDRAIRSKSPHTTVKLFRDYLDRHLMEWGGHGVTFQLKASDRQRALGD